MAHSSGPPPESGQGLALYVLRQLGRVGGLVLAPCLLLSARAQVAPGISTIDITVRVVEAGTAMPLGRAKVELFQFRGGIVGTSVTDGRGRVEFYQMPREPYSVRASRDGYQTAEVRIDIDRNDLVREVVVELWRGSGESKPRLGPKVTARTLSVPKSAAKEFRKGLECLNKKRDPRRSVEHFHKAIAIFPDYPEAYFLVGMAYIQLQAYDDARRALRKSIELNPDSLSAYHPLAVLLIAQRQHDEAETLLRYALERDEQGWQWPYELARCLAHRGRWEEALQYGREAHGRPGAPSKVHLLMVDLYRNTGDIKKALEELEEFARVDPQSPLMPRVQQMMQALRADQ